MLKKITKYLCFETERKPLTEGLEDFSKAFIRFSWLMVLLGIIMAILGS